MKHLLGWGILILAFVVYLVVAGWTTKVDQIPPPVIPRPTVVSSTKLGPCDQNHVATEAIVTDSSTTEYGGELVTGGKQLELVICDGVSWKVF